MEKLQINWNLLIWGLSILNNTLDAEHQTRKFVLPLRLEKL